MLAAFVQLAGFVWLAVVLKPTWKDIKKHIPVSAAYLITLSAIALLAKLLLQLGSTIPSLSDLAFGFRPIVIGYLHLVLLGVITLFLLGYILAGNYFYLNKLTIAGTFVFAGAVILNEILLMAQGTAAITYTGIPYINQMLLGTALLLFIGALLIACTKKNMLQK